MCLCIYVCVCLVEGPRCLHHQDIEKTSVSRRHVGTGYRKNESVKASVRQGGSARCGQSISYGVVVIVDLAQ